MKFFTRFSLLIALTLFSSLFARPKDIISYYPSWSWKMGNGMLLPEKLPLNKITMLNYAFFLPTEEGMLIGKDAEADSVLLRGRMDPLTGKRNPETTLAYFTQKHGVAFFISIGGWADSEIFPIVAADSAKTALFASQCVHAIKHYGFTGIDIDWEYPGYEPHNGTPADRVNFSRFLRTIRDSLDAYSGITGIYYPLSAALPAGVSHTANMNVGEVAKILDFFNLMTYDYHGNWDSHSNHNSPLYPTLGGEPQSCFHSTFKLYHEVYHVPKEKINMGVPFYGRFFLGCTELHGPARGGDPSVIRELGGGGYSRLSQNLHRFEQYWDDAAQVPYLINREHEVFVSYDNPKSIGLKAQHVVDNGLRGLIIWEISSDMLQDGSTPLLDAVNHVFEHKGNK